MNKLLSGIAALCAAAAFAAPGLKEFSVTVDPGVEIGPVKDMHAVNNGPSVKKKNNDQMRAHLTDSVRSYTEVPLMPDDGGSVTIKMQPLSFALIEL